MAMARKPALPAADAIRALAGTPALLAIRVTPNAGADAVILPAENCVLQVRVTAAPEDGKANAAVIALLAKALGVPRSALAIVRGATARDKIIRLPD
jgi:uncharacterized protein YggU (UPF0235/DUF167 family)